MATEYRVVVKTIHGTTRRIHMGKKGRDDAIEVAKVYADATTPYYMGSTVDVEAREVSDWKSIIPVDEGEEA